MNLLLRKICLFLIVAFNASAVYSQTPRTDSLKKVIATQKMISTR